MKMLDVLSPGKVEIKDDTLQEDPEQPNLLSPRVGVTFNNNLGAIDWPVADSMHKTQRDAATRHLSSLGSA